MKTNKYLRMYFAEPDDAGGTTDLLMEVEPEMLGGEPEVPAEASPAEPVPVAAPQIDYSKFTDAIAAAFPKAVSAEPVKPQMSQAEINKLLKKFEVDDGFLEKFDNITTRKQAMNELVDRIADHAEARAQVHTYGEVERVRQTFAPQLAQFEQWQAQQRQERFYKKYSDLAKPELAPLIGTIWQKVTSEQKFADENSAFDATAKGVERIIQSHTPTFKLKVSAKTTSNPNELPTVSSGSGGGGGQAAAPKVKGPPGIDLFTSLR